MYFSFMLKCSAVLISWQTNSEKNVTWHTVRWTDMPGLQTHRTWMVVAECFACNVSFAEGSGSSTWLTAALLHLMIRQSNIWKRRDCGSTQATHTAEPTCFINITVGMHLHTTQSLIHHLLMHKHHVFQHKPIIFWCTLLLCTTGVFTQAGQHQIFWC